MNELEKIKQMAHDLCLEIEALQASEQQTKVSILSASLSKEVIELCDKIRDLWRYEQHIVQDGFEGAYVEVSRWDAALQALAEVAPNHPLLKGEHPNYGVWTMMRKRLEELKKS